MKNRTWLISWIGAADLECAEDKRGSDLGPIATALCGVKRYDRVYLLTNYDFDRSKGYCTWLEAVSKYESSAIDLYSVDLTSPIDYGDIYTQVSSNLQQAGPKRRIRPLLRPHLSFCSRTLGRATSASCITHCCAQSFGLQVRTSLTKTFKRRCFPWQEPGCRTIFRC